LKLPDFAAVRNVAIVRSSTTGSAGLVKVQAEPGEQFDPNKKAQTGLVVYAVMATLKLVPTSFI
jgi:hypothetical protein